MTPETSVEVGLRWSKGGALAIVAVILAITIVRYTPPAALGLDAPATAFSGARARAELATLLGDGAPHPTGSPEADRVRDRVVSRLRALGYTPEVQDTWICSSIFSCARVQNVLALKEGSDPAAPLVMLSSHYDSVAAGPGASDDGSGVAATLELARVLAAEGRSKNGVLLFINDGEEGGLKGAEAFVAEHPLAQRVGAVVNLEARGTGGSSLMFETSEGNGRLIELFADHVTRPATNSIYYTIYKLLPNDTDLTVYKRVGLNGLNFAYVGNEVHYHTPLDDLAHTDVRSLQHHGQNALAMVRALADTDLTSLEAEDVVFFDLLTLGTIHFSQATMRVIAWAALALAALLCWRLRRSGRLTIPQLGWGGLAAIGALLLTIALAALTHGLLEVGGAFEYFFIAHPAPARLAFTVAAVAATGLVSAGVSRRAGTVGLGLGVVLLAALAGVVAAHAAPGLSYPFALPALAGVLGGASLLLTVPAWLRAASWAAPLLVSAVLWLPVAWLLYDGIGIFGLGASAVVLQLLLCFALPALHWRGRDIAVLAGCWLVACAIAVVVPDFTEDHPQKLNFEYQLMVDEQGASRAQWAATTMTGELPEAVRSQRGFSKEKRQPLPWPILIPAFVEEAAASPLPPPTFEASEISTVEGNLRIRGRLASPRGAHDAGLIVPEARLLSLSMNGKPAPAQRSKNLVRKLLAADGWINLASHTTGTAGVEVEFLLEGPAPAAIHVWDATSGLPAGGEALRTLRPKNATAFQAGDRTLITRALVLAAPPAASE